MSASEPESNGEAPIAVVGGGLAGLTAALDLVDAGKRVALFERRPFVGGKAYSFQDPNHDVLLDNGQHITMRCCTAFQALLERLGCEGVVRYQRGLEVAVIDPESSGRRVSVLSASRPDLLLRIGLNVLPAPLHLAPSLAGYEHLTMSEKARLGLAFEPIRRMNESQRRSLDRASFAEWLRSHHQSERVIDRFWDLIILPTCNDRSADVSAAQAIYVFQEGFSRDPSAADIGNFVRGLGAVAEAALTRLRESGAQIQLRSSVTGVVTEEAAVTGIRYGRGETLDVSGVVLALPPKRAQRLIPTGWRRREPFWRLDQHEVSPIVNVHMQWDRAVMRRDFVAVLDDDAQFIFNRSKLHGWADSHWISVSLSGAHEFAALPQSEVLERVERAVRRALRRTAGASVLATRVIKESEATFRPKPGMGPHRLRPRTSIHRLVLAGAWTDTGWPATMESAVRSGHAAAAALSEQGIEQEAGR